MGAVMGNSLQVTGVAGLQRDLHVQDVLAHLKKSKLPPWTDDSPVRVRGDVRHGVDAQTGTPPSTFSFSFR